MISMFKVPGTGSQQDRVGGSINSSWFKGILPSFSVCLCHSYKLNMRSYYIYKHFFTCLFKLNFRGIRNNFYYIVFHYLDVL